MILGSPFSLLYSFTVELREMSRVTKTHYQAKYDYEATGKGQLNIKVGDKFVLVSKTGDEWWTVRSSDGNLGLVPASYLEPFEVILSTKQKQKTSTVLDSQAIQSLYSLVENYIGWTFGMMCVSQMCRTVVSLVSHEEPFFVERM